MPSWVAMARLKAGASRMRETPIIDGPVTPTSVSSIGPTSTASRNCIRLAAL